MPIAERHLPIAQLVALIGTAAAVFAAQPPAGLNLVGAAETYEGRLRLTPAQRQLSGAAWHPDKQPVACGFEATFRFQLSQFGGLGPGADGLAFVLQSAGPRALAGRGSAGGFALGDGYGLRDRPGIPNSIAVFFDTYRNGDADDPSDNFIVLATNGRLGKQNWPPPRLGIARHLPALLKDGRPHLARIVFAPPLLSVYLDGREAPVLKAPLDLRSVVDDAGHAWIGFTASTGNGYENHDILDWSFNPTPCSAASSAMFHVSSTISFLSSPCLPDRNLCTPEEPMVEARSPSEFHVVLPAHLAWGAEIHNPAAREVEISNLRGTACSTVDKSGTLDCAGELVQRTRNGRTEFSIEFPTGAGAKSNQGYLEFDVRLR